MLNKIYFASCGYCINDIKFIFKGMKSKKMKFPANCFAFHHSEYGYILYDTGYTTRIYKGNLINKLYTKLNPTIIKDEDTLVSKLSRVHIMPEMINYIILSHMHPDHIGGLKDFKNAKILISRETFETYKQNRRKDLIFRNQVPDDFEYRLIILEDHACIKKINDMSFYDFFGEELLILDVSGHSNGQLGLYLPVGKLLIVADSYWIKEEIKRDMIYTFITKQIMSDYDKYKNTHKLIHKIMSLDDEIVVVSSHEQISNIKELGHVVKTYDIEALY